MAAADASPAGDAPVGEQAPLITPSPSPAQPLTGLTSAEAAELLAADGPNELPSEKKRNLLQQAWAVVGEPMILLLLTPSLAGSAPRCGRSSPTARGFNARSTGSTRSSPWWRWVRLGG